MNKNEAEESVLLTHGRGESGLSTVLHQWHGEAKLNSHSLVYSLPVANIFVYINYSHGNTLHQHRGMGTPHHISLRDSSDYSSFLNIYYTHHTNIQDHHYECVDVVKNTLLSE